MHTAAEARVAVEEAILHLGLKGAVDVLATYANEAAERLTTSNDKLAQHRAASDHRTLVQTSDRLYS